MLGARPEAEGVRFRVWARGATRVDLELSPPDASAPDPALVPMEPCPEGDFEAFVDGAKSGWRYTYRVDGRGPFPDPASRWQPEGVHGPSEVVDPRGFSWSDGGWKGTDPESTTFYELHVGTFTPEGTFRAAAARLPWLRDLGISTIELMPVAAFAGRRNWGYDGAALYSPAPCYGPPDALRRFIDEAHGLGLGVVVDVVYNHFGPDGAYVFEFSPGFRSRSPGGRWGTGLAFTGASGDGVRRFFIQNALMWIEEYHVDGLRLDATHAIDDPGPIHFVAELTDVVREAERRLSRRILVIAEDDRNLSTIVQPAADGGWGSDMVWADDFHHQVRRALAGDTDGYFADFDGTGTGIAATIRQGWYFTGQYSAFFGGARGTDPSGIPPFRFVICIQNHDQIGNRAFGDRLSHAIDRARYRVASALVLLSPQTPLIFMGQEWAASTPFLYFTDHEPRLGRQITRGRRREFARFRAFSQDKFERRIPDPQDETTFLESKLDWSESGRGGHVEILALYRALIGLRRCHPALRSVDRNSFRAASIGHRFLVLERRGPRGQRLLAVFCLHANGRLCFRDAATDLPPGFSWTPVLTTEDESFAADPIPPIVTAEAVAFQRPGAVVLEPRADLDDAESSGPRSRVTSTYRFEMRRGGFPSACSRVPYLHALGISHVYSSPLMRARSGSSHGYDVCDPGVIDPALGSEADLRALVDVLRSVDMGLVVDFVPNHMAADEHENPWWRDVLEHGRRSAHARFFDIDWTRPDEELRGRVLLPILPAPVGRLLRSGKIQLAFDSTTLFLRCPGRKLPINAEGHARVIRWALDRWALDVPHPAGKEGPDPAREGLTAVAARFEQLASGTAVPTDEDTDSVRTAFARTIDRSPAARAAIVDAVEALNADAVAGRTDGLLGVIGIQFYRLAHWRSAMTRINYRRFFDIDDLVALRMDVGEVFDRTHARVLDLCRRGLIDGLRLDHVDGLLDPTGYLWRLRRELPPRTWVVVEKILTGEERLPDDWPVEGTTGYNFLNVTNGLFVEPAGAERLRRAFANFTAIDDTYEDIVRRSKTLIIDRYMQGELVALGRELARSLGDALSSEMRAGLREIVARFPVYRIYPQGENLGEADRSRLRQAIASALRGAGRSRRPSIRRAGHALLDHRRESESDHAFQRRLRLRMRLGPYTSAVHAKGVEDTAFYRYTPLASLDEVGGNPDRFGVSPAEFHRFNAGIRDRWPASLQATSTHDTKRGQDVRARINVLSEVSEAWEAARDEWSRVNAAARRRRGESTLPDPAAEHFLYQTLVGTWPPGAEDAADDYVERITSYMQKAVREAHLRTNWIQPSAPYERALDGFIRRILVGPHAGAFLSRFLDFQSRVARIGVVNSLAQVVLHIASPGVADIYQGAELWDLNLVDPDNRRPVDFDAREAMLEECLPFFTAPGGEAPARTETWLRTLVESWTSGKIKLFVIAGALRLRRELPDVFLDGSYLPLDAEGPRAGNVVAFARSTPGGRHVVAVVPRLVGRSLWSGTEFPLGSGYWCGTRVLLPPSLAGSEFRDVYSHRALRPRRSSRGEALGVGDVLGSFPVALLRAAHSGPGPRSGSGL